MAKILDKDCGPIGEIMKRHKGWSKKVNQTSGKGCITMTINCRFDGEICSRIVTIPCATKVQKLQEIVSESLDRGLNHTKEAQGHLVVKGKNLDPEIQLDQVKWNEWPPILWAEMS